MRRFLHILATAAATALFVAGSARFSQALSSAPADARTLIAEQPPQPPAAADVPAPEKDKGAAAPLDATEMIAKITVQLDIGTGDDLQEPIALDLGLGYPLWLHPVGHKAGDPPLRGAIPEETTAKDKIAAGESALFTFTSDGDAGQDQFRTSRQLLANTKVGDIARVGFSCAGTTKWVLAGYDITINDKPFASGKPNVQLGERDAGTKRLAELATEIGPLEQVRDDMTQLLLANQLEESDKAQLKDVLAKLAPLARQKTWLEGQLEGKYPWFVDPAFKASADAKTVVRSAKVTLLTFTDQSADTANYVFARIGGRKYFISSPDQPLTGQEGPQIFDLDLLAGPLTDADLRDWAVGMLAAAKPYDIAPDRWHGQRVQFEVDDKVRYNSEDSPADRMSLMAVRLIPPAHLNKAGSLVTEEETDGLVYLWDPTKGSGLDPATKAPLPAPPPDGPDSPPDENPGPAQQPDGPVSPPPDDPNAAQPDVAGPTPDLPEPPPPGVPDDQPPGDPATDPSQQGFGSPFDPFDSSQLNPVVVGIPIGIGLDMSGLMLALNQLIASLPLSTPITSGNPPQVTFVRFSGGLHVDEPFTVEWNMTGDLSQVAFYQVDFVEIQPDQPQPVVFSNAFAMPPVGPGAPLISTGAPAGLAAASPVPRFLQARVTAVTNVGSADPPNEGDSAARMVFPAGIDLTRQPFVRSKFKVLGVSAPSPPFLLISNPEPPITAGGVWKFGDQPSGEFPSAGPQLNEFVHQNIRFAAAPQGRNLFMRPANPGDRIGVRVNCPNPGAASNLIGYLSFRGFGAATGTVTANVTGLEWFSNPNENPSSSLGIVPLTVPITATGDSSTGMATQLTVPVDPRLVPGLSFSDHLAITIEFSFNGTSPTDPPVLFGLRLIP